MSSAVIDDATNGRSTETERQRQRDRDRETETEEGRGRETNRTDGFVSDRNYSDEYLPSSTDSSPLLARRSAAVFYISPRTTTTTGIHRPTDGRPSPTAGGGGG